MKEVKKNDDKLSRRHEDGRANKNDISMENYEEKSAPNIHESGIR